MPFSRFLDPKNDYAFKQIFGTEKNKDILIHFLNDILQLKNQEQIIEVTFLRPIQDPDIAIYRQSIVDVLCCDEAGTQIIIEMQVSKHKGFEKRAQYYAAKAYSSQIIAEDESHKGMAVYAKLKCVIFLAIADFIVFEDKKDWISEYRLHDTKTYKNDLKDFHFIFIELPKFKKTSIAQLENVTEKWTYFFKYGQRSTLIEMEQLIGSDMIIKRAFQVIDQAGWSEEELRTYEHIVKTNMDNAAVEEQKIEDAEVRGEARGEARGAKNQAKVIAKNLRSQGFDIKFIAVSTGLTEEEVEGL